MVSRRKVIGYAASAGFVGVSGCLDETGNEPQGNAETGGNQRPQQPTNQESRTTTQGGGGSEESEEPAEEPEPAEPVDVEETDEHRAEKEEIARLHADSIRESNSVHSKISESLDEFSAGNYALSQDLAGEAQSTARNSNQKLSDAITITYEIDHQEARNILEEAEEYNGHLMDAASALKSAGLYTESEEYERSIDSLEESEASMRAAENVNPRDSRVMHVVLDLD